MQFSTDGEETHKANKIQSYKSYKYNSYKSKHIHFLNILHACLPTPHPPHNPQIPHALYTPTQPRRKTTTDRRPPVVTRIPRQIRVWQQLRYPAGLSKAAWRDDYMRPVRSVPEEGSAEDQKR